MTGSRWQRWRRISQIFFLLLFLVLLVFTALRAMPGTTSDIHLRGPVRLFFEWDPLIAVTNAITSHALYRGLFWSLMILVPTFFLALFLRLDLPHGHVAALCGQHALRVETRQAAYRVKSLQALADHQICGVARGTGGRGIRIDGDWLARSLQLAGAFDRAFNFARVQLRGARRAAPLEHSHVAAIKATGELIHAVLGAFLLEFRQAHFAQGLLLGVLFAGFFR